MNVIPTCCWICLELDLHLLAELEVERAERLVEQQHLRPVHQRPRERDALPLATRQLARPAPLVAFRRTIRSASVDRARRARPWAPCGPSGRRPTLSPTVMCGNSA